MPNGRLRSDLVFAMPFSNLLHLPFAKKVEATRLAGFAAMTIQPQEVLKIVAEGTSIADMRTMAADGGIEIGRLDPLCTWVPNWHPTNFDQAYIEAHDIKQSVFFDLCEQLGCKYMSLNATFPAGRYTTDQIAEYYAAICKAAAEHGVTCDMECIPMWGVTSLEHGWEIVKKAGAPNGGFVFDCTHFIRGGSSLETLKSIPGHLIHCVQVCDGYIPLPLGVTLEEECFERLWPGDGDFPIADILRTLNETRGLMQIGPEVFSAGQATRSAQEIASMSVAALVQYDALRQ
jgi:sugar phosphate isomerase/epimerase